MNQKIIVKLLTFSTHSKKIKVVKIFFVKHFHENEQEYLQNIFSRIFFIFFIVDERNAQIKKENFLFSINIIFFVQNNKK